MIKATYHHDSKEPKEKHVMCKLLFKIFNYLNFDLIAFVDVIECLRGSHKSEVSPKDAFNRLFERLLKNLSSWACLTKVYVILHRCL